MPKTSSTGLYDSLGRSEMTVDRGLKAWLWLQSLSLSQTRRLLDEHVGAALPSAYVHPYGFAVLRLFTLPNDWGVRLHMWGKSSVPVAKDWQIHDHAWDLASRVLAGSVIETRFVMQTVQTVERGHRSLYEVERSDLGPGVSELRNVGSVVGYGRAKSCLRKEGESYLVRRGVFHTSRAYGEAATLVVTEPKRTAGARVVGPVDGPRVSVFERSVVNVARLEHDVHVLAEGRFGLDNAN